MTELSRVAQIEANGCGIACLAMLEGRDYDSVRAEFPDMTSSGLSEIDVLHWLNARGWFYQRHWIAGTVADLAPTLALAMVQTTKATGHWIVITDRGILDPARETPLRPIDYGIFKWIPLRKAETLR